MSEIDVPIISLAGYFSDSDEAKKAVIAEVKNACEKCGFFMIKDHNVNMDVFNKAFKISAEYFNLPLEEKEKIKQVPGYPYGYSGMNTEIAGGSFEYGIADCKECVAFCLGPEGNPDPTMPTPLFPENPVEYKSIITAYYREMEKISAVLCEILALGLGEEKNFFENLISQHWSALRLLNYPHSEKPFAPGQFRISPHTDYGCLTVLGADSQGGLELQQKDGSWKPVTVAPNCFTINLGDLISRMTNDRYKSTWHRVVPPTVEFDENGVAKDNRRLSIAYFHNLNKDAMCGVFKSCIDEDHPCKYEPINAFDHLMARHAAATGQATLSSGPKVGGADITQRAWSQDSKQ